MQLHTAYHGRYEDTHHETRSYRIILLFMRALLLRSECLTVEAQ